MPVWERVLAATGGKSSIPAGAIMHNRQIDRQAFRRQMWSGCRRQRRGKAKTLSRSRHAPLGLVRKNMLRTPDKTGSTKNEVRGVQIKFHAMRSNERWISRSPAANCRDQSPSLRKTHGSSFSHRFPMSASGYSTETRYKPFGITVIPAFARSILRITSRSDSGDCLPSPISVKVPTMARTIL